MQDRSLGDKSKTEVQKMLNKVKTEEQIIINKLLKCRRRQAEGAKFRNN